MFGGVDIPRIELRDGCLDGGSGADGPATIIRIEVSSRQRDELDRNEAQGTFLETAILFLVSVTSNSH